MDTGTLQVLPANEHLYGFYDERTAERHGSDEASWVDDGGALSLGGYRRRGCPDGLMGIQVPSFIVRLLPLAWWQPNLGAKG